MITNVSLASFYVTDVDEAKAFYIDKLGFVEGADITMGDGYRWCTLHHPDHPELQLPISLPGPPLDAEDAELVLRLVAKGALGGIGLATDDCRKTFDELTAKGVEFIQEPSDRPYGVEAVLRDSSGNWLVMIEAKPYTPEDMLAEAACPNP
jgi:catechol 2,3-dioxygenase-like lactoylglutathione lyase family enzyme